MPGLLGTAGAKRFGANLTAARDQLAVLTGGAARETYRLNRGLIVIWAKRSTNPDGQPVKRICS